MLNDSAIHTPPTTGNFAYNSFNLTSPFMPVLGGTYVDPVFGETVRVSYRYDANGTPPVAGVADDIYAHHWANSDGTLCFATMNGVRAYNPVTGAVVYSNMPSGNMGTGSRANLQWHPTDPDLYFYFDSSNAIRQYKPSTATDSLVVTLASLGIGTFDAATTGGSHNWVDGTGDLFVIPASAGGRVWKRSTNTLYAGVTANFSAGGGWLGISPNGNSVLTAPGPAATPNTQHYYYPINHVTHTVGSPIDFWGLMSDHFSWVNASDGHDYGLMFDAHGNGHLYVVDMTISRAGLTEAQQIASAGVRLVMGQAGTTFDNIGTEGHMSGECIGANRDWIFVSAEQPGDTFNSGIGGWKIYEQEIIAVNMVTLECRRLAHHRSRSTQANYAYGPKPTTPWDGSRVIWQSNMNTSSPVGAVYNFSVAFSGGGAPDTTPPAAPTGLQVT